ncbi:MAG TPA: hypothetical protein PLP29_07075 [Candidatus Ozemobacteraceae bacterium]|mgnify:FL=1|nr:MAG: hypothetical protein BWY66_00044 [bacterium ADurb.Bin374]HOY66634.1 hypothetical protein [Candidatus Ozemobacteraceae bacterium]
MIANTEVAGKTGYLCIIENDPSRIGRMTRALESLRLSYTPIFFEDSRAAIGWLEANAPNVGIISLDYDLYRPGESMPWPGDGMDVVEWLESSAPKDGSLPMVIVHSARCKTAQMMENRLKKAGYRTGRVVPHENTLWIEDEWVHLVSTREGKDDVPASEDSELEKRIQSEILKFQKR